MADIIIYPQGDATVTVPNIIFDSGTNKIRLVVNSPVYGVNTSISFSSSTASEQNRIGPDKIVTSGTTITGGLYVGLTQWVNSSAIWVGPTTGLAGAQGSQGAQIGRAHV